MITRRQYLAASALSLITPRTVAQGAKSIPKIGLLRWDGERAEARREGLARALHARGYTEGKNIIILARHAGESAERADQIVREFIQERVAVIVAAPTPAAHAARRGTATIPIVLGGIADPLASGLVTNLARPGGNVTGVSLNLPEVAGKRAELLRDAFPTFKRIAFLGSATDPATKSFITNSTQAAGKLGLTLHVELIGMTSEFDAAFGRLSAAGAQAVIVQPIFWAFTRPISALALKHRLPTVSDFDSFARDGGLMSYGPSRAALLPLVAEYIDKILKGAKPGELPIQQPTHYELIVNLKTAKALGVTIPPFVLDRANEVIR